MSEIKARNALGVERPWSQVVLPAESKSRWKKVTQRRRKPSEDKMQSRAEIAAQGFQPYCPREHQLPDSLGQPRIIGVIGNVNASKSHFLAGAIFELIHRQSLHCLEMDVAYLGDSGKTMDTRIEKVYSQGEVLPNTEKGTIDGPFSYRLTTDVNQSPQDYTLSFFDVAGEDCISLTRSVEFARYLFDAIGIIILLDPDGLPRPGRPLATKGTAALATRAIVDILTESIERVTGAKAKERDQMIVLALAKADSADLKESIWPPDFWTDPSSEAAHLHEVRSALRTYSDDCRGEIIRLGGRGIVDAAELNFGRQNVMCAAISATNQEPIDKTWPSPEPVGCSIPIAQIFSFSSEK
jgi:hypothetical protein